MLYCVLRVEMGGAQPEGERVFVQAMEQNGNDPQPIEPRGLSDRGPRDAPESVDVMRWIAAGIVAAAALLGLVVLVAIVAYALQPPGWLQMLLGIVMAAGAAIFAWLLASALGKDDRPGESSRGRRERRPRRR